MATNGAADPESEKRRASSSGELELLAAEVGRPVSSLADLAHLTPAQLELLRIAVRDTRTRRRREVDAALATGLGRPVGRLVGHVLRSPRLSGGLREARRVLRARVRGEAP